MTATANKTDAGRGSYGICHVIDAFRSPSRDAGATGQHIHGMNEMNIFDLIVDQLGIHHGWRSWCPLIIVAAAAAVVHFTIGWSAVATAVFIFTALIAALAGVFWQWTYNRDTGS